MIAAPHSGPVHQVQSDIVYFAKQVQHHVAIFHKAQRTVKLTQDKYDSHVHVPVNKHRRAPIVSTIRTCRRAPLIQAESVVDAPVVLQHSDCHVKVSATDGGQAMSASRAMPAHVKAAPRVISNSLRAAVTCVSSGPAAATACHLMPMTTASVPVRAEPGVSTTSSNGSPEPATAIADGESARHTVAQGSWPNPEDDDYDPAKPEYRIPMTCEDLAREERRILDMQIAALEGRLHREATDSNKKVTDHYFNVVGVLRRSRMAAQQLAEPFTVSTSEGQNTLPRLLGAPEPIASKRQRSPHSVIPSVAAVIDIKKSL